MEKMSKAEARKIVKQYQILTAIAFIVLLSGTTFYHYVENWRWLDSLYFSVISLATVGYGDFSPKTDLGKIFTIFYLIIGLGIFAALLNNLIKSRMAKRSLRENGRRPNKK
jgi:voltage-gated potassium channel